MVRNEKEQADKPTAQDYRKLIDTADMLLESFRGLKTVIKGRWHWWSITVWARRASLIPGRGSVADYNRAEAMWKTFAESMYLKEYIYVGGARSADGKEFVAYFVTGKGSTQAELTDVIGAAESAVKSLMIQHLPKHHIRLSEWLDVFHRGGDYYSTYGVNPAEPHAAWPWFEFMFNMAEEVGSPLRVQHMPYINLDGVLDVPPLDDPMRRMPPEEAEYRLGPEFRTIAQDMCEASILALQFLRQKAEERLRPLEEAEQPKADSTRIAQPAVEDMGKQEDEAPGEDVPAPQYVFRNKGATWRIVYGEYETDVDDLLGVQYIHRLLHKPEREKESIKIEAECNRQRERDVRKADESLSEDDGMHEGELDLNALDRLPLEQAVHAAKGFIAQYERKLDATNDPTERVDLQEQIAKAEDYINQNVNKLGKVRPSNPAEDARKRVSAAVNTAKREITKRNPAIGKHFQSFIRASGTAWVYAPDRAVNWILS